jgi:hypothetical protein
MYGKPPRNRPKRPYSERDSRREGFIVGMQDKFNEAKDKFSENSDDIRDKAEELYNKAKESPMGDKMDEYADKAKEMAQDAVGKFKGDKRS